MRSNKVRVIKRKAVLTIGASLIIFGRLARLTQAYTIPSPTRHRDLGDLLEMVIGAVFTFTGVLLLLYLILGGITYLTAGGDDKRVGEAKKMLTNAVVGMLIVFTSFWIIRIVEVVFGLVITGLF